MNEHPKLSPIAPPCQSGSSRSRLRATLPASPPTRSASEGVSQALPVDEGPSRTLPVRPKPPVDEAVSQEPPSTSKSLTSKSAEYRAVDGAGGTLRFGGDSGRNRGVTRTPSLALRVGGGGLVRPRKGSRQDQVRGWYRMNATAETRRAPSATCGGLGALCVFFSCGSVSQQLSRSFDGDRETTQRRGYSRSPTSTARESESQLILPRPA